MIQGLWHQHVKSIIDIKLDNADAAYLKYEPIAGILDQWGTIKKDKHGKHCNIQ